MGWGPVSSVSTPFESSGTGGGTGWYLTGHRGGAPWAVTSKSAMAVVLAYPVGVRADWRQPRFFGDFAFWFFIQFDNFMVLIVRSPFNVAINKFQGI